MRIETGTYYTVKDISSGCGFHPAALTKLIRNGKLTAAKVGTRYFVRWDALQAFLEGRGGRDAAS